MSVGVPLRTQVIVVGAGPVGLLLAGELRLGGTEVTVLERLAEPTAESRASTLHARTMELLDSRDLLRDFGELPGHAKGHFGGIPLDLTLPGPYPGQWKAPQVLTEAVLQRRALSLGAKILRGHELTSLTVGREIVQAEASGPRGPLRLESAYLVGCDGEQSTIRKLTGFDFPGQDMARELIRADVAGISVPDRRFERREKGLAIASRRDDGVTRVMVHDFGRAVSPEGKQPEFADIRDAWLRVTGEDIGNGTPLWVNAFGDASRQVTRYRQGRVLLAGDAAHIQMPIGGQALNLGLQDAFNLGWKLAAVTCGRAPDSLLDTYDAERHLVGAQVLNNIKAQALLLLGGPEVEPMRDVLGELIGYEPVRERLAAMISGLDIRYGDGDDSAPGARLLPMQLTAVDGVTTSTAVLLRAGRGLLLDFSEDSPDSVRLEKEWSPWADRVDLARVRAAQPGPQRPFGGALLVRPDGYVAWAAGSSAGGPGAVLEQWFGPPCRESGAFSATRTSISTNWRTNMDRFAGKTALVTGASRGMGRAIAQRLAREGALVAVHYATRTEDAEETVASIEKDGGRAFAIQATLGKPGDVHELFLGLERGLKERTGSTDLNVLINNAGLMGGVAAEDITPEKFDELFAVNAKAPFFIIQRALSNLVPGSRIVNTSSGLTRVANPDEIVYAMSKGAVEQLAVHFAKLLAPRGITVNSVAPGITRNSNPVFGIPEAVEQMAQLSVFNRVGEPEDIADIVAFLASDDARWMTGAFVDATGGTLLG